ncbi:PREDICTED: cyclin-dependent kinase-like 4 [Wasmannia auropunctata]|uniref:cyclin-dependent kinase-like 4 n=1 Tax=Wasmannia auropunctata TaxID=64793 RepID=UPI0005EDF83A|nr:PREDICTED: cyclin-dependent kinase-like 4 [Wasmannia auropunctata]XP_011700085.1 PREDICTED: cyclin-dependent kinase-like 4 [Wasmannia auropunctata]XP_011700086.1 PREDICTED: cyclin-dependent kinase-like 4 [Wasmannia auropunctata]
MEKYENIEIVGEGSYGLVMKCRHRETQQIVAIKKFLETEEDVQVRKMAFREIRMLKKLRHENLVNMIEVFRRRKRLYLVFEYLDHTVLDELEKSKNGLDREKSRRYIFQILRGLDFCHNHKIMHRDVKPENVLVSPNGVIKLCDFGFARYVTNESCTDYVATRWYRAPELLVGDSKYGREIDVWAAGCIYAEMITGQPLFPGDSDVDQLYRITKALGSLYGKQTANGSGKHVLLLRHAKPDEVGLTRSTSGLRNLFPTWSSVAIDFLTQCLRTDPAVRPKCLALLQHPFFSHDGFADRFLIELQRLVAKESAMNVLGAKRTAETSKSRICRSSIGRWQMSLIKERRANNNMEPEVTESEDSPGDRVNANAASKMQISRPRELRYFGPVSVIPNTTYIRRLEHKGLLIPESKGCALPALTPKTNAKRKKLDLPSVKNY